MARDYDREARELERAMLAKPMLSQYFTPEMSLIQMANIYASGFYIYNHGHLELPIEPRIIMPSDPGEGSTALERFKASFKAGCGSDKDRLLELAFNPPKEPELSEDQKVAWEKLKVWAQNDHPYFILKGYAGTGKTFLLRKLKELRVRTYYSAPTNKAAKVLGSSVGGVHKTTYSILGLRMEQQEDRMVLIQASDPPYFPSGAILVVDEASMVPLLLVKAIEAAREGRRIKILYVGDPMQLPPVGEIMSKAWIATKDKACRVLLKQVMRYDNELLALCTALRLCIKNKNWDTPLESNHEDTGVWRWKTDELFVKKLLKSIESPESMIESKLIAWRNDTVNRYNKIIRKHLGFTGQFCEGEIILLADPIEKDGQLIAHTDDEGQLTDVQNSCVVVDGCDYRVHQLYLAMDNQDLILNVPVNQDEVDRLLALKANMAKSLTGYRRKEAWKDFWSVKAGFHRVRYGYAITAHRSQGSTFTNAWVDQFDILSNSDKREAFRCLYVACSRPTTNLHSY